MSKYGNIRDEIGPMNVNTMKQFIDDFVQSRGLDSKNLTDTQAIEIARAFTYMVHENPMDDSLDE